jgi:26S proteasome regulatory subunit N2
MVPRPQSSAAGVLALLVEQEPLLKQHALKTLISLVPQFWAEISEHIAVMYVFDIYPKPYVSQEYSESLYENPDLPIEARNSAALLASKVYYYLEEYDEALTFALGAGNAFQPDSSMPGDEEYIETLICGALSIDPQTFTEIMLLQPRL